MKNIYFIASYEEIELRKQIEKICHTKARAKGYSDWWVWYYAERNQGKEVRYCEALKYACEVAKKFNKP